MPLRSSPETPLCSTVPQLVAFRLLIWNVLGWNGSSTLPSQSLSTLSQSSDCGVTSPVQVPG